MSQLEVFFRPGCESKFSGKTDPSEIVEPTKIRKQQARFYQSYFLCISIVC